jgi:hypothetical protein
MSIQLISVPATFVEIGGLRLLTDRSGRRCAPLAPTTSGCGLSPPESASHSDPVHLTVPPP